MNKQDIKELNIIWDIECQNHDYSKLATPETVLFNKKFTLEYHPLNTLNSEDGWPDLVAEMGERMINLINFVKAGHKVIPPQFVRIPELFLHDIDTGFCKIGIYTIPGLCIADGCHRVSLAKSIGLSKIPILIYDFDQDMEWMLMRYSAIKGVYKKLK